MTEAVRLVLWTVRREVFGEEHPATRAAFGRYIGSRGHVLSAVGSGRDAWVGCCRQRGQRGFQNRAFRRALSRSVTPQDAPWQSTGSTRT